MGIWIIFIFISLATAVKKQCPGGTFTCPDSATCCPLTDKSYGCCPLENAVCCDDHIHCCPANSKCATGMCIQSNNRSVEIHSLRNKDVICDDQSECPDDTTCCKNPHSQKFGCCPMENAVCCDDGLHCCPEGTICDLEEKTCNGDGYVTQMYDSHKKSFNSIISNITLSPLRNNKKSMTLEKELSVICPGEQFQCPDGYTCCKLPNQDYGCCPFVKASCCKDGLHCCPENMHCDATSQYCSQGPRNVTSLRHIPAKRIPPTIAHTCPDHSSCEDFETCCKTSNSTYGCCSYVDATCCSDLLSCCPSDMICDVEHRRCLRKEDLVVALLNNLV